LLSVVVEVDDELELGVVVGVELGVVVGVEVEVEVLEPEVPPEPGVVEPGLVPQPGVVMTLGVFDGPEDPTTAGVTGGVGAGATAVTVLRFEVPTG
jgi:hypothetical protein